VEIVTDNDPEGRDAIADISRLLKDLPVPVWEIRFGDCFPAGYDMADPVPPAFWHNGRYRGPHLSELRRFATWATRQLPLGSGKGGKTPVFEARATFRRDWLVSVTPTVLVHKCNSSRLLSRDEFNAETRPFSDVKDTADLLIKKAGIQVVGVGYEPGLNPGMVEVNGRMLVNTFAPTRIGKAKGDIAPFLEFITHLFPVKGDRDSTLKWVATLVARPNVRMRYGLLLISETQGVGKGTLVYILGHLVGWHNTSVPNEKMLVDGAFTSHLVRKRLVAVHEIYAGQVKKAYDNLKSYVTDDTLTVNEKYLRPYEIANWTHFLLCSNSLLALRLVKGDRRWAVPKVTEQKRAPSYWIEFYSWLVDGGLEIIHQWAYDYVAEHGGVTTADEPPASEAKEKLIEISRSEGQDMIYELGKAALVTKSAIVLTDQSVRDWLSSERQLTNHAQNAKLESLLTIRKELKDSGMQEITNYKLDGKRFSAWGNPAATEQVLNGFDPDLDREKINRRVRCQQRSDFAVKLSV
jgi:hypothetical protein